MLLNNRAVLIIIFSCFSWLSVAFGENSKHSASPGINPYLNGHKDVTLLDQGSIILYWTAPGDDGDVGRASGYDLRYRREVNGPIDSESAWIQALQIEGEPIPSLSGQTDSMIVANLTPGAGYYFCIKAYDDAYNFSGLSNSPLIYASGDTGSGNFIPGDVNNDNMVNGNDIVFLVGYFRGVQDIPYPFLRADVNGSCIVNGLDVVFMVNYLRGGAPPIRGICR